MKLSKLLYHYILNLELKGIEDSDALIWKEEQLKLDLKKIDLFAYLEVSIARFENFKRQLVDMYNMRSILHAYF